VIGDTILDEYQYCDAIGKSSKDPTLALKYQSHDLFAGGVLAVANHVANFASSVQMITFIGDQNSQELFIRRQLYPNVTPHLLVKENSPTTIKRRFVDGYSFNKLLEIYVMNDSTPEEQEEQEACNLIKKIALDCDLVIAADFGHGAISHTMRETLINSAPFLAVNTQANAGNRGFHTITRYPKADYCCIAEHELHLETRSKTGDLRKKIENLCRHMHCQYFTVTLGRKGSAICSDDNQYVKIPSFTEKVIDRVGAGDTFFGVTSLMAAQNAPLELIGFIGNIVGSLAVKVIGNKKAINRQSTEKFITSILK
jgi:bifunctional ADP-heptose synthase (sugar kinase/adenylyltransferase)